MLSQVVELIEHKHRFAITSHIRPDGDSLGSSLGLYWLLRALDKDVEVVMRDSAPHAYQQLPGADSIRVTPAVDREYDAVFVIECSDIDRPGLIDLEKQFVVNIDHHTSTVLFGTINWIDSTASAVGEMIYNLCKATGVRPSVEIAECVYTALLTDTGSFHYSNTSEAYIQDRFGTGAHGRPPGENRGSDLRQLPVAEDRVARPGTRHRETRRKWPHRLDASDARNAGAHIRL
jgi:phosphoesterase RecJ-like protein